MSKNDSGKSEAAKKAKNAEKETAKATEVKTEAPASVTEETVAPAPEAPAAKEEPTVSETAPEETAPKSDEGEAEGKALPFSFADIFNLLGGERIPEGFAFAPEGFVLDLELGDEVEDQFCGGCPESGNSFASGIKEGLLRANHPAYGIGLQQKPLLSLEPIQVVDETTASFGHLVELKKLHELGVLTDDEYNAKKTDILRRIY